jgi:signal transduction histidine kinase
MLAAVNINIGTVQKRNSSLPEMKELDKIVLMLQDTAAEVRKTAHNLMPDVLSRHTLPEALRSYCEQINIGAKSQIDLQFYGQLDNLDKPVALSIYRIMQELIHNVIKHAQATHAAIQIRQHAEKLYITVEDNGIGFKQDENTQGIGLRNLKKRIETLDGQITIESEKQMGTIVHIEFSLPKLKKAL